MTSPNSLETLVWFLLMVAVAVFVELVFPKAKPKRKPGASDPKLLARHRRINERSLWNDRGFTLPQMLWGIAAFTGVLLFLPVVCFIITTVMGAQEPRW